MKTNIKHILFLLLIPFVLSSCTDVIDMQGPDGAIRLVVDAIITNEPGVNQVVTLSKSQNYFNNSAVTYVKGATVTITDSDGKVFEFKDLTNTGNYVWKPANTQQALGAIGKTYTLQITSEGETYKSVSELRNVPKIDSVQYQYTDKARPGQSTSDGKLTKGYDVAFFAKDLKGLGDCYRIKAYRNGKYVTPNQSVTVAYDAALQKTTGADNVPFYLPVRFSISPELYAEKDTVRVELYSISEGNYDFWTRLRTELNNAGLFATPPTHIPTNVTNVNSSSTKEAMGWFTTSAVSKMQVIIDAKNAKTNLR